MSLVVFLFFFLMIRRPPRSTLDRSSAASDVYKRQDLGEAWKRGTSLPFVYAVMVLGPGAIGKVNAARMSAALRRGIEEAPIIAASYNLSLIHI